MQDQEPTNPEGQLTLVFEQRMDGMTYMYEDSPTRYAKIMRTLVLCRILTYVQDPLSLNPLIYIYNVAQMLTFQNS